MNKLKSKLKNKKGFTLIEMLIVVAIIAILVVIAVPVVNSSIKDAKDSTDNANLRAAKTVALSQYISDKKTGKVIYYYKTDGTVAEKPSNGNIDGAVGSEATDNTHIEVVINDGKIDSTLTGWKK